MHRCKDRTPAVRLYTVCDESRYLVVKNVPAVGCGDDLLKLFAYGDIEECKPMDEEDCEPYTDVYWIKFCLVSNARFAKRKLDEFSFLGNRLQVSYAPHFESLLDTMDKLEGRRKEVLSRLNIGRSKLLSVHKQVAQNGVSLHEPPSQTDYSSQGMNFRPTGIISSCNLSQEYFASESMNQTVKSVREKLNKIQSSGEQVGPASKKTRVDNRKRI
ncbi:LOW QUALITY PROTEIN: RRM_5 domain-containing protein [Cephalotus follicularis]|uniref:RNA-binding protein 48 n=1 Tax=Cephalotus follicularis TaxID=3775 RepID=A0A1Q3CD60_CEPFO|nr:LOW QUALITY PROTEIN: RRM_5 domain-containing protein [Cephalotus follicularis]